jgi:hypothetical protein
MRDGRSQDDELAHLLAAVVARLRGARRTFTDEEALRPVWEAGYELSPQHDSRFALAWETSGRGKRHWHLTTQTLANDRLLDALQSGQWDGRNLDAELARLDAVDQVAYIFCPIDPRFVVHPDGTLEHARQEDVSPLPSAFQVNLDPLGSALLEQWQHAGGDPWTSFQVAEALEQLGWADAHSAERWLLVQRWLLHWDAVVRVGTDYWLPVEHLPVAPTRAALRVRPIGGDSGIDQHTDHSDTDLGTHPVDMVPGGQTAAPRSTPKWHMPDDSLHNRQRVWTVALRTVYLVEGFLPVPPPVRSAYPPRAAGAGSLAVLSGVWFATDDRFWVWLDREHDRLYGPVLADHLAWCEAGEKLQVAWAPDRIILQQTGHDVQVYEEEARLVDSDALAALRGGRGESYRQSIQALLEQAPAGLSFAELVAAVRERQAHTVHHGTIRAILSAGGFLRHDGRWFAASEPTTSARQLRTAVVESTNRAFERDDGGSSSDHHQQMRQRAHIIEHDLSDLVSRLREGQ